MHAEAVTDLACAAAITALVLPLFRSTSRVLLQSTPEEVHDAALERCLREALAVRGVRECVDARFWAMAPVWSPEEAQPPRCISLVHRGC